MSKLDAADRKAMPKSEFAGKGKSFPIPDKEHARLAISGATRSEHAGNVSPAEAAKIKAKARKKLGKGKLSQAIQHAMGEDDGDGPDSEGMSDKD